MSILIKGMEMPKSCRACHLKMNCDDCEGLECVCVPLHQQIGYLDDLLTDKCRDDCPLVPVPEHGDLVERQAVLNTFSTHMNRTLHYVTIRDTVPTIIPAEEGDDAKQILR